MILLKLSRKNRQVDSGRPKLSQEGRIGKLAGGSSNAASTIIHRAKRPLPLTSRTANVESDITSSSEEGREERGT
ncbi:hypothetical protein DPMN_040962 [Dreissena polymorpha]|uniref:Uncharacterized protein n=1 Tax=Dreissena polymorpha TaxID=45954 RepID=A0A9D4CZB9_DREPO|nr:hypothetical protein DPMN_040962 [Dreissena polymorpha]